MITLTHTVEEHINSNTHTVARELLATYGGGVDSEIEELIPDSMVRDRLLTMVAELRKQQVLVAWNRGLVKQL